MKTEKLELQSALKAAAELPFAVIAELSTVTAGYTPGTLDPAEWVEAHFFDDLCEIRFQHIEGKLEATLIEDMPGDTAIERAVCLPCKFDVPVAVWKKTYLEPDEDGQMQITGVRLAGKEGTK